MKREYLSMPSGDKIPAPLPYNVVEFNLPGNMQVHLGGALVAVYDGESRTGAIWCSWPRPYWSVLQPILRDDFFDRHLPQCLAYLEAEMADCSLNP